MEDKGEERKRMEIQKERRLWEKDRGVSFPDNLYQEEGLAVMYLTSSW